MEFLTVEPLSDRLRDVVDRTRLQLWRTNDLVESLVELGQQHKRLLTQLREAGHERRRLRLELLAALTEARQYLPGADATAERVLHEVEATEYLLLPLLECFRDVDNGRVDAVLNDLRSSA